MMECPGTSLFAAVVEVTNRCNFRCPFCASDSGCARENEMSLDEMRGVVRDLASLGCREFTMLGGEFLLLRLGLVAFVMNAASYGTGVLMEM